MQIHPLSPGSKFENCGASPALQRERGHLARKVPEQKNSADWKSALPLTLLPFLFALLVAPFAHADHLLMTLSVESATVHWHDDFVLTLEIYGVPGEHPPEVGIDGLDQFQLKGTGKNMLLVPGGKTVKWILTYSLTAIQDGIFKLGPATAIIDGRNYNSNTLFITVEAPQVVPKKEAAELPMVHSAQEVGDKVLILLEAEKKRPYRTEGITVSIRLLSQLPVENLRFRDEADFPGLLKYDFPFSAHPKAEWTEYENKKYASYELQKFLLFPLKEGTLPIPAVSCELTLRVPSGAFAAADLRLQIERSSNALTLQVLPVPDFTIVGSFTLRNQVVLDHPFSKTLRLILEGDGELSTFDLGEISGTNFTAHRSDTTTISRIQNGRLMSRKSIDVEINPIGSTTSIVIPGIEIAQFDPGTGRTSWLRLPPLPLRFAAPGSPPVPNVPLPDLSDSVSAVVWILTMVSVLLLIASCLRRRSTGPSLKLSHLCRKRNPNLQIPKAAARKMYQQILAQVCESDEKTISLLEALEEHLPPAEWSQAERAFQDLERTAFSQGKPAELTYGEMKRICEQVEKQWQTGK